MCPLPSNLGLSLKENTYANQQQLVAYKTAINEPSPTQP